MIAPFWGELALAQTPLEVSHNYCSHKCSYCFANLNSPNRTADVKKIFNQLAKADSSNTFTSRLIKDRFPICVSNKTDPFATSNYKIALPMLKMMVDMGIPIEVQSRGGRFGVQEFLDYQKQPMVWYISITHTKEEVAKLVEPGAPSLAERWALCDQLKSLGHKVIIAINPYSSFWVDNDEMQLLLEKHRPDGVIMQHLHINHEQIARMSEREKERAGEALVVAQKRKIPEGEVAATRNLYDRIRTMKIPVLYYSYPTRTFGITEIYRQVYPGKSFNTHFSFTEWCFRHKKEGDKIYLAEYLQHMTENIPFAYEEFSLSSYVTSICNRFRKRGEMLPSRLSLATIYKIYWNDHRPNRQLNQFANFQQLMTWQNQENNEITRVLDKNGDRVFVFTKKDREGLYHVE